MQLALQFPEKLSVRRPNTAANKVDADDRAVHEWYRFVLSYPPHLVREYIHRFELSPGQVLLDPFCGTGTTVVEAKLFGIHGVGLEANPVAHFAATVKTDWSVSHDEMLAHARMVVQCANHALARETDNRTLPPEAEALLLKYSISPLPLHKVLVLMEQIRRHRDSGFERHELLALAKVAVTVASNLYFGPEVGVRSVKKLDAPVLESWLAEMEMMVADLSSLAPADASSIIHLQDSRQLDQTLAPASIDAVITSPPYPNEKDYTRTTRLESVLLGFLRDKADLRMLKQGLLRSNTRNVYKGDDDDVWVASHPEIQKIAAEIEHRRIALGKTSGFERMYSRVTKLYFGGMSRHLAQLRPFLKPGAQLAYVVGDQASYLQVMIRTGEILADIASSLGYEVVGIDLFRTRLATATRQQMREEVVVLRWPGTTN